MFRTVGVDDLLVALTVAGLGLGLPAVVAFVVAWILNSLGSSDVDAEEDELAAEPEPRPKPMVAGAAWGERRTLATRP